MPTNILPLLLTDRECASLLRVGLTTFRDKVRSKVLPAPIRIGRRVLWPRKDIEAFTERLSESRSWGGKA